MAEVVEKEAAVLDSSGVETRPVGQAIQRLCSEASAGSGKSHDLYGIIVYRKNDPEKPKNTLSAHNRVCKAYWHTWRVLRESGLHSVPHHGSGSKVVKKDFGDIRVTWGCTAPNEIKQDVESAPGTIFFMPSHLNASILGWPELPEPFRAGGVIVQVRLKVAEHGTVWDPWESLVRLVEAEHELDPKIEQDTIEWRRQFMSETQSWTSAQVARESSSTAHNKSAIASRWQREKRIFAVFFEGKNWFPRFQFRNGRPIPAVSDVIRAFPERSSGWDLAFFFATPNSFLGGQRPMELLKKDPQRLESLARTFVNPTNAF